MGSVMQVLGAGVDAVGTQLDIGAKNKSGVRNWNELERSASMEEANAVDALRQGEQDAGRLRMKGTEMVARQRMAYAASGVDASVGTPAQVAGGTSMWAELDAQTARNNAMRKAFGFKESARKYRHQASDIQDQLDAEQVSGALKMVGGMLKAFGGGGGSSGGGW